MARKLFFSVTLLATSAVVVFFYSLFAQTLGTSNPVTILKWLFQ